MDARRCFVGLSRTTTSQLEAIATSSPIGLHRLAEETQPRVSGRPFRIRFAHAYMRKGGCVRALRCNWA